MDRRDSLAGGHCHRIHGLSFFAQHQPDSLSDFSFPFRHGLGALRILAFLYAQGRTRGWVRHFEHPAFPRLESDVALKPPRRLDSPLVSSSASGHSNCGQPRRMASKLYSVTNRQMAGCCAGYLRGLGCASRVIHRPRLALTSLFEDAALVQGSLSPRMQEIVRIQKSGWRPLRRSSASI